MRIEVIFLSVIFLFTKIYCEAPEVDQGHIIGIDLGTTYSCVGVYKNNRVEIVANDLGNRITPSYVAFTENGVLVGEAAKAYALVNPEQTLFDVKRLIGRDFTDPSVTKDIPLLPYKIVAGKDGKAMIEVKDRGEVKRLIPSQVSAMILTKMKEMAESYLGEPVKAAVITVPAYFNDSQRDATKLAGTIAGLDVKRIINEPTAAALAFGISKQLLNERHVLVYDLGGGTFDVSLLIFDGGVFEVLATSGDTHLGGEDFDQAVMKYMVDLINKKDGINIKSNLRALQKLRKACEQAKRNLSVVPTTVLEVEDLDDNGYYFKETLSRAKFEELCIQKFRETLIPIADVLKSSDLDKSQINDILLVGGSTRIPKIKELLKEYFDGKEPIADVNADEAVAHGATVQASILSGKNEKNMVLLDVCPLGLGIETAGNVMTHIIPKNTAIPTSKSQTFSTFSDNQTSVEIKVYEGERAISHQNHHLGSFTISGIPPAPKGVPQIKVTFDVDANGILSIHAIEKSSNKEDRMVVRRDRRNISDEAIKKMIADAEKYAEEDKKFKETVEIRHELTNLTDSYDKILQDKSKLQGKLTEEEIETLSNAVQAAKAEMAQNNQDIEALRSAKLTLENETSAIMTKFHQSSSGPGFDASDEL